MSMSSLFQLAWLRQLFSEKGQVDCRLVGVCTVVQGKSYFLRLSMLRSCNLAEHDQRSGLQYRNSGHSIFGMEALRNAYMMD